MGPDAPHAVCHALTRPIHVQECVTLKHILGISWAYLGCILGIYLEYLGHIYGISLGCFLDILGISWIYFGSILGIF